jgi:predicted metal-dependent peptidase
MDKVTKLLSQAKARMLMTAVFWSCVLMSTWFERTTRVPRAATDMKKIMWNPDFFGGLTVGVICFVLAHEVMHIVLRDGLRRGNRDPDRWNRACDYRINWILWKAGFELWEECLFDKQYANMSAEQIYEMLKKDDAERKKNGGGEPKRDGLHGDVQEPADADDPAVQREIEATIKQAVSEAATYARMAGQGSPVLERLISEVLEPQVHWLEHLRHLARSHLNEQETWNRRNRRFRHQYLPSKFSETIGDVAFTGDTSGSIDNTELCKYGAESRYIYEELRPSRMHFAWVDSDVRSVQTFEQGDPFDLKPVGGGGTDMRKAFDYYEDIKPEVMIMFTDGFTPWPKVAPSYPCIICCTTAANVPDYLGDVVRIK